LMLAARISSPVRVNSWRFAKPDCKPPAPEAHKARSVAQDSRH